MRLSNYTPCRVFGPGVPFSLVTKEFNGEQGTVDWADHESDEQWVQVKVDGIKYRVHSIQCVPDNKEIK